MLIGNKRLLGALTLCHTFPKSAFSARLAQSVECKALNLVVVGSSPTVGAAAEALAATPSDLAVSALRSLAGNGIPPGAGQWTHALGETRSGSTPASWTTGTRGQCQVTATLPPHGSAPIADVIWSTSGARLAQPVERKALNLVVVVSSPTVGVTAKLCICLPLLARVVSG